MTRRLWAALAFVLALGLTSPPAGRAADCPPAEALLVAARGAARVQIEQLGADELRIDTPLAHVPGRSLGYEVHGRFRVTGAVASALREAFGRRDSYACAPDAARASFETPVALPLGLHFGEGIAAVTVVLHLPEGVVELQAEGVPRVRVPLSRTGQQRWETALTALARQSRTTMDEFYRQMAPPDRPPATPLAPAAPADTASAPR